MMKSLFVAAALSFAFALPVSAEETVSLPGWMTGAWGSSDGESWADEYWTPPRAGIMIGASRAGEGEKLKFWEHMRIVIEADGKLAFWAIAGDQKPVRFGAVRQTDVEIVFENPDHDYPQRIRYWREGNELKAEISLIDGSKAAYFFFNALAR